MTRFRPWLEEDLGVRLVSLAFILWILLVCALPFLPRESTSTLVQVVEIERCDRGPIDCDPWTKVRDIATGVEYTQEGVHRGETPSDEILVAWVWAKTWSTPARWTEVTASDWEKTP